MSRAKKPRLGRGLSSLMAQPVAVDPEAAERAAPPVEDSQTPEQGDDGEATALSASSAESDAVDGDGPRIRYIAVDAIAPNPHQPRQQMDAEALERLAGSIRQDGVMQPIVVRPASAGGGYELVAGERRWRAARQAGLERVPAVVRELTDQQLAEWALVENLQREDLDPIERARAFARLIEAFHVKQDDLAARVGVDRSTLANTLRLLDLPEPIQKAVQAGRLSAGHARALLAVPDDDARIALAERAMAGGWSVRMIEAAVKRAGVDAAPAASKPAAQRPAHLADLEQQIAQQLNTKVQLKSGRRKGSGALTINFYSLDEFDALLDKLGVKLD